MADVPPSRSLEKTRARVDSLRVHPRNPRTISLARMEQLQRTLEAEPEMLKARPLIALPDGTVVAGNQRLLAARALGWEEVPVVFADLSEDEVTRWMLLDNRPFDEDDREQAAVLLAELEARVGDAVYDPFAGSGSTLISCESLGMVCYAMELSPAYCDVIRQRYADYVGRPDLAP